MAVVPTEINEIIRIGNTKWSFIQETPTLKIFYHDDLPRYGPQNYHVSVFLRPGGIDVHATYVFYNNRKREWSRRHHGWCLQNGQQTKRKCRRPIHLHMLFNAFQDDVRFLLEPALLRYLPPAFYSKF